MKSLLPDMSNKVLKGCAGCTLLILMGVIRVGSRISGIVSTLIFLGSYSGSDSTMFLNIPSF